jgi:acid phosphatase
MKPLLFRSIFVLVASLGSLLPGYCGASGLDEIKTIVVIYGENRSFDNLYGLFPGADGIANALKNPVLYRQLDRDGKTPLAHLPPVWNQAQGDHRWDFVGSLPNRPFLINAVQPGGAPGVGPEQKSPDLVHRYYQNQMQIAAGSNSGFAAWSDAGGLAMGYYDGSAMALWKIAREYTLADHFFMGAFGGSFLNHQWLICACAPPWQGEAAPVKGVSALQDSQAVLALKPGSANSALEGAPKFVSDGGLTPLMKDGRYYAVNTIQPAYQPSSVPPKPAAQGEEKMLADANGAQSPLPAISASVKTIGDTLSAAGVNWKWYAGGWNAALQDGTQEPGTKRSVIYSGAVNFQPHHQPFNYYQRFNPLTSSGQAERSAHLNDYDDLVLDIKAGKLPPVVFYKPQGNLNQHPGYTDVMAGDAHIAEVIQKLQASSQWNHMLIIVTYDENGGFWDHVSPPKGDVWGPGNRVPTLIISPYAKRGFVDHQTYDTSSILKLITRRFNLEPLPGVRDNMGDLTHALILN